MKVLWITNILFPEAEKLLTGRGELKASGGWMTGLAKMLVNDKDIDLYVATTSKKVNALRRLCGDRITYYVLPMGKGNTRINADYCPLWKKVHAEINPDIIHIHGTEFSHGHAYMKACGNRNVVISIQGLTSAYYYYYYYGITKNEIYRNLTIRDILRGNIIHGQKDFKKRSEYEIEMLRMTRHIIGRTSWDKARTWAINPDAQYHFCNEVLRPEFYENHEWSYEKCNKHSIFVSQAVYPIKGLHQLLKAMPLILRQYPDAKIRIAGYDITRNKTFKDRIRFSGYGHYIKNLINSLHLESHVIFTGNLNASQMIDEYLKSNVFVCPSTIENSPNSLGEAQILGVPCVASYVGGIPDMMQGYENNMYRFEEIEMMAYKVCEVFTQKSKVIVMNKELAHERHNQDFNANKIISIYKSMCQNK